MKKNIIVFLVLAVALVAALISLLYVVGQYQEIESRWKTAEANVKAYDSMLSDSRKENAAFQLTVDQLHYFQDSILKELSQTQKELKIKDSKLKALQYISTTLSKKDTIVLKDTIFREPSFSLDTLIGDEWYKLQLGLSYPSTIAVKPEFRSEKHILVSTKKETVDPPKKFFLLRWLQKKHTVLSVDVVEKNPYTQDEVSKYIEILK